MTQTRTRARTSLKVRPKARVVVTRRLPEPVESRLRELFDVTLNGADEPMSRDALLAAVREVDILVPTITDIIDKGILFQAGERLKLIANFGNGVDNIDVAAADSHGIMVTNTPDVLSEDTADMTMALILAVPRRLSEGIRIMRSNTWQGWSPTWMLGRRIWGKRLGIIGLGRIGQAVARRARAFGMRVHYHNRRRVSAALEEELQVRYWESLDQMLARMDVVSIHCPHTPATYHLLSARRLKLLPPHAYIVNTARGEIVDENALVRMLNGGDLAGAALDVFEHEPAVNSTLAACERVLLLPHMSSATMEGRMDMGERVILNIKAFLDGQRPPDRVVASML